METFSPLLGEVKKKFHKDASYWQLLFLFYLFIFRLFGIRL